jgi:N-acetylglucosamine-6-sulfatase
MRRLTPLLVALACLWAADAPAAAAPNVVLIETDDQTGADMAAMPQTRALIGSRGVTFANSFVSLPSCCPSRATLLTGRYAHNHGVLGVLPPFGGYYRLDGSETLPVWLQRAGYATGVVGKYLNGYGSRDPLEVPPGWTEFQGLLGRDTYRFYGYTFSANGRLTAFGSTPADFQTDVITQKSVDFVRRRAPARAPFFLWTTYVAPHTGRPHAPGDTAEGPTAVPAPRHRVAFAGVSPPQPPSFDEADVSDKPYVIRRRPRLGARGTARLAEAWRRRRASLLSVDEGVASIVGALRDAGELDSTLLVFTSDNGFMAGEHRVPGGKLLLYEPSIRVPLLMRGPGIPAGVTRRQLVWNGDLAPTILAAAGARASFPLDGRSLLPFGRDGALRDDRALLLEGPPKPRSNGLPRYTGVRTRRAKYVQHLGGARELYDLAADPYELDNLAGTAAARPLEARLREELERLRGCAGASCR